MRSRLLSRHAFALGISSAAMASLFVAPTAVAQTVGTIQGSGAPAGATVTATDTVTGRSVTTTATAAGTFTLAGLRPSSYQVKAGERSQSVTVPVATVVTVDLTPVQEVQAGDVVVIGRRPRAEVRTATIATNVSPQQIESLPQTQRNFLNFAALAPA